MSDPSKTTVILPAEARRRKACKLAALLLVWRVVPDTTMFGATIHEYGGEAVDVRLPKVVAITMLEDAIKGLCR